ncbi:hypothetical protein [Shewanella xiamenensis]|uniref:hypothetical protein n=1 Tax=Shewanella xiamenensis TaxID=332186 RepID=UPI002E7B2D80|nr:hypothetical protein [Shewanella xiamenensis]MEE1982755.1 hypothetical protein [Shewanella xiamenensis]
MNFIDPASLSELDFDWLRKFKASKCLDTLDIQVSGAERKIMHNQSLSSREKVANLESINTAFCLREQELSGF